MTYRAKPADGVAWVTGASAGIGRAVRSNWRGAATQSSPPRGAKRSSRRSPRRPRVLAEASNPRPATSPIAKPSPRS